MKHITFQRLLVVVVILLTTINGMTGAKSASAQNPATRVVYLGMTGNALAPHTQLYSVLLDGKNVSLSLAKEVGDFEITPDGGYVIYQSLTKDDYDWSIKLYSIPITGGTPVKLVDKSTSFWQISPDSKFVWFLNIGYQLFAIPVGGGTPIPLTSNGVSVSFGTLDTYPMFTPDSSTVIYMGMNARQVIQLYAASIAGGTPVVLNSKIVSGGKVQAFWIMPDGKTVAYWADQNIQGQAQFFSVPVTGGNPTQLTDTFGQQSGLVSCTPSPMYLVCNINTTGSWGGWPTVISISLARGGFHSLSQNNDGTANFQITHDNKTVVMTVVMGDTFSRNVYSIPIEGGNLVKLATGYLLTITPDDSRVIYIDVNGQANEISITGDTSHLLIPDRINGLRVSPDSKSIVIAASGKIYAVSNSRTIKLNNAPPSSSSYIDFGIQITADSQQVLYTSDQEAAGYSDLFVVPITGGNVVRLNSDESGMVTKYRLFPIGTNRMPINAVPCFKRANKEC